MDDKERGTCEKLVRLIRRIAREVAWEVIDEHMEEYKHEEKPAEPFEAQLMGEEQNG